ncbi:MAG: hypothetical protein J6V09_01275 [Clostridia bacterium]|nr:hypothetical protein [Clostridia bacterium]
MNKKISTVTKITTVITSLLGVVLSFFSARADGYSHPAKRLLYFTGQSNIWIGLTLFLILIVTHSQKLKDNPRVTKTLYALRYVFTVSITVTGFIFCAVLAPGAGNADYNAWGLSSIFTHVLTPTLAIFDFFFDEVKPRVTKLQLLASLIPLLAYAIFSTVLFCLNVDFGRGDPFPYFFLNHRSPAGIFGTSDVMPYRIGSFYWMAFILLVVLGIAALYRYIYNKVGSRVKK